MEKKMYKMPSIEQYRNVIHSVNHRARYIGSDDNGDVILSEEEGILPTLNYRGSVKLHGTNASIVFTRIPAVGTFDFHAQSKNNIITPQSDNMGFAAFVHTSDLEFLRRQILVASTSELLPSVIRVYGEWCGGNIQKGMSISGLDKMFVIFAIKVDDVWFTDEQLSMVKNKEARIYNILDYPTYNISIDFNKPQEATEKLAAMTDIIDMECPVGKAFGNVGFGEGIVWVCTDEHWTGSRYWFKIVGEKHKSSKTKVKVPVDIERVNSINDMVDNFLTEARLSQGLDYLKSEGLEHIKKNTGIYIKWVISDVIKEDLDTIVGNGFEPKEIQSSVSDKAKKWYFKKENELLGL